MALPNENKKPGQKTYVQPHRCRISQLYDLMPKKKATAFSQRQNIPSHYPKVHTEHFKNSLTIDLLLITT